MFFGEDPSYIQSLDCCTKCALYEESYFRLNYCGVFDNPKLCIHLCWKLQMRSLEHEVERLKEEIKEVEHVRSNISSLLKLFCLRC